MTGFNRATTLHVLWIKTTALRSHKTCTAYTSHSNSFHVTLKSETQIYFGILLKQVYLDHLQVPSAFKNSMTHRCCKSHYVSHFTAFFIVARAKRSIVKSFGFNFWLHISHDLKSIWHSTLKPSTVQLPFRSGLKKCSIPQIAWYHTLHIYFVMILPQVHLRKPCYDFYFL